MTKQLIKKSYNRDQVICFEKNRKREQTWSEAILEGFYEAVVYVLDPEICLENFYFWAKGVDCSKSWIIERGWHICGINFLELL